MVQNKLFRMVLMLPLAFAAAIPAALGQDIAGDAFATDPGKLPAAAVASAGILAVVSDEEQPPVSLYGYMEVERVREHVLLANCQDVDTDEFLPEGIAVPFVCDGTRFVAELVGNEVQFFQGNTESPVASIALNPPILTVNGIRLSPMDLPGEATGPASLKDALLGR